MSRRYILVACGSFNPVHNLHLRMLELTKDEIKKRYKTLLKISNSSQKVTFASNEIVSLPHHQPKISPERSISPSKSILKSGDIVSISSNSNSLPYRTSQPLVNSNSVPTSQLNHVYNTSPERQSVSSKLRNRSFIRRSLRHSKDESNDSVLSSSSECKSLDENLPLPELLDSQFIGLLSPVSDGYKKKGLQPFSVRSKLVSLACQTSSWISLSSMEGMRQEWTPTKDVLLEVKKSYNQSANSPRFDRKYPIITDIVFVCGADVFMGFAKPGLWKSEDLIEILENCYIAVISRNNYDTQAVLDTHEIFQKFEKLKNKVIFVEDELQDDLSSTFIRNSLLAGKSIKYLVPDAVEEFLRSENVYTEESLMINSGVELAPMIKNRKDKEAKEALLNQK